VWKNQRSAILFFFRRGANESATPTYITLNVIVAMPPNDPQRFLPLGTSVFHILVALAGQDRHGYSIMQDVAMRTDGRIKLSPGTLYGAIRRLLEDGLILEVDSRSSLANDDPRRRYYRLTKLGHAVASAEASRLSSLLEQARDFGLLPRKI
jgi:DNA-binding PadR family transcriptional regulator